MVQKVLGNAQAEQIKIEFLLECLKSFIEQSEFLLENSSQFCSERLVPKFA